MKIIFTDLDGTVLDFSTYSVEISRPTIEKLIKRKIPIIFCTAKTRLENEYYHKKLNIRDPFIVENGSAIFIPKHYFNFHFNYDKENEDYYIIELGIEYKKLRKGLENIRKETSFDMVGFGDMTLEEVAKDTGLNIEMARLAKKKEYNESFKFNESKDKEKILFEKVKQHGFNITHGGRYYNIFGKNADKGRAVEILTKLFKKRFSKVVTIGIGDSLNDLPMLKIVDFPILVKNKEGKWSIDLENIYKTQEIGPRGFNQAINKLVGFHETKR